MITQCPDCRKSYPVTAKKRQGKNRFIFCVACKKKFDSALLLNAKQAALVTEVKSEYIAKPKTKKKSINHPNAATNSKAIPQPIANEPSAELSQGINSIGEPDTGSDDLPWDFDNKTLNINWRNGLVIGSIFLLGQIFYFEIDKWTQNPSCRPVLKSICHWLGCDLAAYKNLAEFTVEQASFTPDAESGIVFFNATLINEAPFQQLLPRIKLTLLDYNEKLFAQRIFTPNDYLANAPLTSQTIESNETIVAHLKIAKPKTAIGGYYFDLIY